MRRELVFSLTYSATRPYTVGHLMFYTVDPSLWSLLTAKWLICNICHVKSISSNMLKCVHDSLLSSSLNERWWSSKSDLHMFSASSAEFVVLMLSWCEAWPMDPKASVLPTTPQRWVISFLDHALFRPEMPFHIRDLRVWLIPADSGIVG